MYVGRYVAAAGDAAAATAAGAKTRSEPPNAAITSDRAPVSSSPSPLSPVNTPPPHLASHISPSWMKPMQQLYKVIPGRSCHCMWPCAALIKRVLGAHARGWGGGGAASTGLEQQLRARKCSSETTTTMATGPQPQT